MSEAANTIIFCLIGDNFSGKFMTQMINITLNCFAAGYRAVISIRDDINIYHGYNRVIDANLEGDMLKLFANNKDLTEYKAIIFINKNAILTFREIEKLLKSDYPITSAFCTDNAGSTMTITNFIVDDKFVPLDDIYNLDKIDNRYISTKYVTFDTIAFKPGVFESMKSAPFTMGTHQLYDPEFTLLDKLRDANYKIMIDTNVRIKCELN